MHMIWRKIFEAMQIFTKNPEYHDLRKVLGTKGESAVADYVKKLNMRVLYRNWRHASLEIDLVCEDADGIIFVEVKTRKAEAMTSALDGISAKKRNVMIKAANVWLRTHDAFEKPCRFAVATVNYTTTPTLQLHVEFYDNAFTATSSTF